MMFKRASIFLIAVSGLLLAAVQTAAAPATVRFQMGWIHEYSAAGFYMAEHNGHYAAEDLDVALIEGGFSDEGYIDGMNEVLTGEADFSYISLSALLQARAEGKPIVAIGTINQRSPQAILSLADKGIVRPRDLIGKSVAVADNGSRSDYEAMLLLLGIDPEGVNFVPRTTFGLEPILNDEVDALGGWMINEGVQLQQAGHDINYILLSDYGVDTYDLLIYTTEDMINNQPDVVERFLRATIMGHKDVMANPKAAAEVVVTYDEELILEDQQRHLEAFLPLMQPAGSEMGVILPEFFEFTQQLMLESGSLDAPLDDLAAAYNLTFLQKIYGN